MTTDAARRKRGAVVVNAETWKESSQIKRADALTSCERVSWAGVASDARALEQPRALHAAVARRAVERRVARSDRARWRRGPNAAVGVARACVLREVAGARAGEWTGLRRLRADDLVVGALSAPAEIRLARGASGHVVRRVGHHRVGHCVGDDVGPTTISAGPVYARSGVAERRAVRADATIVGRTDCRGPSATRGEHDECREPDEDLPVHGRSMPRGAQLARREPEKRRLFDEVAVPNLVEIGLKRALTMAETLARDTHVPAGGPTLVALAAFQDCETGSRSTGSAADPT